MRSGTGLRKNAFAAVVLAACREAEPEPVAWPDYDPLPYVDPLTGTGGVGAETTGMNPGAAAPHGLVLVGPDSRDSAIGVAPFYHYGGYHYDDDQVEGFSHTHGSGMGIVDYGAVHVMPRAQWSDAFTTGAGRAAFVDKAQESAAPGTYATTLDDGTRVEIAATPHGAHHRYTYTGEGRPVLILDLGHALPDVVVGEDAHAGYVDGALEGYQRVAGGYSSRFGGIRSWFHGTVDPPPVAFGGWTDPTTPRRGTTAVTGAASGLWLEFPEGTTTVELRMALSSVDAAGARRNHAEELGDLAYDVHVARVRAQWAEQLASVRLWGGPDPEGVRARFHTAQYQAALMPREYRDVDGRYRGIDDEIHVADFRYVSDLSLWDTFRTLNPWDALVAPDFQRDVAKSLTRMLEDGGSLPRWPMAHGYTGGMIGSPASIVLAETWLKGIEGWPVDTALDGMIAQSDGPVEPEGRGNAEAYVDVGYVPSEFGGSVSQTHEYAWADHATARLAAALGRSADAVRVGQRANAWKALYDPAVAFAHGRDRSGVFGAFESPDTWSEEYVEGNAWHYLWTPFWDVDGIVEVHHGGDVDAFAERLDDYWHLVATEADDLLPDTYYWHGNEPVMHYAWLGALAGRPELTVEAVDWVRTHRYSLGPEGLDGNDDAGTLSAWYLWSVLGLYPVAGTDQYALARPAVARAEIRRADGADLVITSVGSGEVAEVLLDGVPLHGSGIGHADLLGASLEFAASSP